MNPQRWVLDPGVGVYEEGRAGTITCVRIYRALLSLLPQRSAVFTRKRDVAPNRHQKRRSQGQLPGKFLKKPKFGSGKRTER